MLGMKLARVSAAVLGNAGSLRSLHASAPTGLPALQGCQRQGQGHPKPGPVAVAVGPAAQHQLPRVTALRASYSSPAHANAGAVGVSTRCDSRIEKAAGAFSYMTAISFSPGCDDLSSIPTCDGVRDERQRRAGKGSASAGKRQTTEAPVP